MSMEAPGSGEAQPPSPGSSGRRRPRYRGTHPRRFEERYKELDPDRFPGLREHVLAQGRTPAGTHVPVLVKEVLASLEPHPGDVVVDCTIGYGGHAVEVLPRIVPDGRLIGLDVDGAELERTRTRLQALASAPPAVTASFSLHRCHFAGLPKILRELGMDSCDIILADLGVSSMQIDDFRRGFSYKHDGPLDMRMDDRATRSAAHLVATLGVEDLELALRTLADEPDSIRISRLIVDRRRVRPISTSAQLVQLVFDAKRITQREWRERGDESAAELHPAARTFQALRMLVNDELPALEQLLRVAPHCLRPGGRFGVISFHSGEDQRVAESFRQGVDGGLYAKVADVAIRPSAPERAANPRSASARFRWAIRSSM